MNIWLITIGEPIPHPENKLRLHRTGIFAKYISENSNHEVTWWTSAFNHFTKESVFTKTKSFNLNDKLKIIAIKGKGYKKNVSLDRIIDHAQVAKEFSFLSKNERVPDIIVASFPTLGLCNAANKFAKDNNIPLLIDYRDLWPEVFTDLLPLKIQFLGKIALFELFRRTNKVFKQADGIIGITKPYLQIALDKIKRQKNKNDAVFPLAYLKNQFSEIEYNDAEIFWETKNIKLNDNVFRICFFGTLGYQFDFDTVIAAARSLTTKNIQFVFCGTGDRHDEIKEYSKQLNNIILPGYINAAQIKSLMERSSIGLCPYYSKKSFLNSIPGKAIEYLSAGLPLLNSLSDGVLGQLVNNNKLGFNYIPGSKDSLVEILLKIENGEFNLKIFKENNLDFYKKNYEAEVVFNKYMQHLEFVSNNYN